MRDIRPTGVKAMAARTTAAQAVSSPERPPRDLVNELPALVTRLVRDEVKLAQAEMTRKGKQVGVGAGLLGGSGVIALYGVACLLASAIAAISMKLHVWLAALIIGAAVLAVAGVAALVGRSRLKKGTMPLPQQAIDSVKADISMVKARAHR
jgi:hypothetical protein